MTLGPEFSGESGCRGMGLVVVGGPVPESATGEPAGDCSPGACTPIRVSIITSSSHAMITARAISEKRHVGRPMAPRLPGSDPGPGRRSCRLRSRVMIAKPMIATDITTRATSTTSAAGLLVGRCRSATGSLPGRYPRNAHAVTNNSAITATARAVDLSIPAIGTPIGWAHPILARACSLRVDFLTLHRDTLRYIGTLLSL